VIPSNMKCSEVDARWQTEQQCPHEGETLGGRQRRLTASWASRRDSICQLMRLQQF
jgi:hypothetical protein